MNAEQKAKELAVRLHSTDTVGFPSEKFYVALTELTTYIEKAEALDWAFLNVELFGRIARNYNRKDTLSAIQQAMKEGAK
jgi:hypothetical protein